MNHTKIENTSKEYRKRALGIWKSIIRMKNQDEDTERVELTNMTKIHYKKRTD